MGMFDYVRFKFPLPLPEYQGRTFQTKDTDRQFLELYEVDENGSLHFEDHDVEDRSDPNAEGIGRLVGMYTRVNKRMVPCDMTGEIRFYDFVDDEKTEGWVEFSCYFVNGKLSSPISIVEHRHPGEPQ